MIICKTNQSISNFKVSTFTSNVQYLRTLQEVAERGEVDFAQYLEHVGPQPGKGFKCTKCGKILVGGKTNGTRHVEAAHFPGTFEYECEFCGKKLNSGQQLSLHKSRSCTKKPNY